DFYNGLPSFTISNFLSVNNTDPQDNIAQTISFSEQISYRHSKQNLRVGFDVRRVHQDFLGGGNPLGGFTFTGLNTESPQDRCNFGGVCQTGLTKNATVTGQAASGAAFADFLLGLPQQSQIQAGLSKIYLRENVVDWYANDDYRLGNGLTLNGGLRYEFFGPFSEINNRLVNLTGVTPGTTSVGCVTPDGISVQTPQGTLTCAPGPTNSLIHPDRTMFSPRLGIAWRPRWVKDTVVRAGYGINYNTGQFATFAHSLAYQAPFAATQNNVLSSTANSTGCNALTPTQGTNFTVANAFNCSGKLFQNTYAVDPKYRLGLVQVYNLDVQRTLPLGIVLNLGYNGSHGGNLNVVNAPNHAPSSVTTPDAVAFLYQQSIAECAFNALTVNAQKRLQKGIELGAKYQYAHSIDDASSINGAAETSSIQDPANLLAERSNSSFDVRHSLTGNWLYELPVGPNRAFLNRGGFASKLLDGFNLSGSFNITSGRYFTPSYQATAAQIAAGGTYTLRPDRNFSQTIAGAGALRSFFNGAAFTQPPPDRGYGTASRYSIEGPGTLSVSASLSRTIPLTETRSFEARVSASNVFNTVQYNGINTTLDSAAFGQVTGAAAMRQITFVGRFRF
ncbi:MAG: carboxypeptidase regulatory-like domain-containing protein, partial [Rhodospirillales bacterium]|nr:carboxypeptidase regulatory-like domain-containing protein [Acetobacter sp.]